MPSRVRVVGAEAVGKTSFVLALGATEQTPQRCHAASQFTWSRTGRRRKTAVHIVRNREAAQCHVDDDDDDDDVFVLLFDLTRRDSLAAVLAQWGHLLDSTGRRLLLLVGTHADCLSKRSVSPADVREISGDFHAYEEVCCRPGHSGNQGMLRVQLTLTQWMSNDVSADMTNDVPLARASICGGFPRPVVTMMLPASRSGTSPRSPSSPQHQRILHAADEQLTTEDGHTGAANAGDVKLRTISKAIYDIRSAVAEKSKALAKYRDRRVTHWLTRSRYFGPTESSRHKRWHEEQKKRQLLTQCHVHYHHDGHMLRQSKSLDACLQDERGRSVSFPTKCNGPGRKASAPRGPVLFSSPSSSESESEEGPAMCLEQKGFAQQSERLKQRHLEPDAAQEQRKRLAAKRALRKQRRAASDDMYERSTAASPAIFAPYLNCYDEMDVPSQLQPSLPSLDRRKSLSRPLPSSTSRKSLTSREHVPIELGGLTVTGVQHAIEGLSFEAEPVDCIPLMSTHAARSPVPGILAPSAPLRRPSLVHSHHSAPGSLEHNGAYDLVPSSTPPDEAPAVVGCRLSSSSPAPAPATDVGTVGPVSTLLRATPRTDASASRANFKCGNSSEAVIAATSSRRPSTLKASVTLPF